MLLVDDEPRLRAQLAAVLADYGVAVLGEAGNRQEGVELACRLRPRQAGAAAYLVKGCRTTVLVEEIRTDDGRGFTTTRAADPIVGHLGLNHFGLASMRQQLEMAGGSWQVHSRPGNGTTITATLPLTMS